MAGKRGGRKTYPNHLPFDGKGIRVCQASGFYRPAADVIDDVRQGLVSGDFADLTPGFGTKHPQDVRPGGPYGDPTGIPEANPGDTQTLSVQDLNISAAEMLASIKEDRPPRPGF